jgi:hypothetical protein
MLGTMTEQGRTVETRSSIVASGRNRFLFVCNDRLLTMGRHVAWSSFASCRQSTKISHWGITNNPSTTEALYRQHCQPPTEALYRQQCQPPTEALYRQHCQPRTEALYRQHRQTPTEALYRQHRQSKQLAKHLH